MKRAVAGALLIASLQSFGQEEQKPSPFTVSGYVEVYYSYDFNKPENNAKPGFMYSHNRHNEFNLNLGFIKGSYNTERVRANLALAAGTYMNANYAAEPGVLKNIYEANAGVKLSKKQNLWLDAGIFASHIGFESAISKDCWTLTRSIVADNSPYYETGAKFTWTSADSKWLLSGLVLNGWQRINRVDGNSLMSFGTQVQFRPSDKALLNYSTFIGTDKPDSVRLMRYYHNLYGIFTAGKLGITAGFDIGSEQKEKGSSNMNVWYTPVLILRYPLSEKWTIAARGEYYSDEKGVIIASGTENGFQAAGYSLNIDYAPVSNALIRLEARSLKSRDNVFTKQLQPTDANTMVTASIAISF